MVASIQTRRSCLRVVIVDSQPMVLRGFRSLFEYDGGLRLVGSAVGMDQALAVIRRTQPDVVLVDIEFAPGKAVTLARRLESLGLSPRLLGMSVNFPHDMDQMLRRAGLEGCLDEAGSLEDILQRIRGSGRLERLEPALRISNESRP